MRIQMTTLAAGPEGVWPVGSIQDVSPEEARALVAGRHARYVGQPEPEPEVVEEPAQPEPVEEPVEAHAVKPTSKPKRRRG